MLALDAAHPSLSFINSIDRLRTFCRLCINSSDWWANENECNDSDGKRVRSSVKFNVGDAGPGDKAPIEHFRGLAMSRVTEFDRGATDPALDELVEGGNVGAR